MPDQYHGVGGRYEIIDGERVLVKEPVSEEPEEPEETPEE